MKSFVMLFIYFLFVSHFGAGQVEAAGVRGDSLAITEAEAMVESMGGLEIWAQLKSVHFVHEWFPWYRVDSYIENEILDLTAPRSWVEMKSEKDRLKELEAENKRLKEAMADMLMENRSLANLIDIAKRELGIDLKKNSSIKTSKK